MRSSFCAALFGAVVALSCVAPRFAQTSAPGIVNSWTFDQSKKAYGRISGGGSAAILKGVTLNTVLSTTVGRKDGNDVSGQVGLNIGF